jgi:hypothetical protein
MNDENSITLKIIFIKLIIQLPLYRIGEVAAFKMTFF